MGEFIQHTCLFPDYLTVYLLLKLMIADSIKEGFQLANKNLPLVLVRIGAAIINIILLVIFLSIPVIIAVIYMGFDLAHAMDLIPHLKNNPAEIVTRYVGLAVLFALSIILYVIAASMLYLYLLSGTLGVLNNSGVDPGYRFSMGSFFSDAGRNFWPLFRLLTLVLFVIIVMLLLLLAADGLMSLLIAFSLGSGSALQVFLNTFIVIALIVFTILVCLAGFIVSAYSMIVSVADRVSAYDSVKKTFVFIRENPKAIPLYFLLVLGISLVSGMFFLLKTPFNMLPVLGSVMGLFFTIVNACLQSYLAIVLWGSLVSSYLKRSEQTVYSGDYEI